jgi:hypothetical protein
MGIKTELIEIEIEIEHDAHRTRILRVTFA